MESKNRTDIKICEMLLEQMTINNSDNKEIFMVFQHYDSIKDQTTQKDDNFLCQKSTKNSVSSEQIPNAVENLDKSILSLDKNSPQSLITSDVNEKKRANLSKKNRRNKHSKKLRRDIKMLRKPTFRLILKKIKRSECKTIKRRKFWPFKDEITICPINTFKMLNSLKIFKKRLTLKKDNDIHIFPQIGYHDYSLYNIIDKDPEKFSQINDSTNNGSIHQNPNPPSSLDEEDLETLAS